MIRDMRKRLIASRLRVSWSPAADRIDFANLAQYRSDHYRGERQEHNAAEDDRDERLR